MQRSIYVSRLKKFSYVWDSFLDIYLITNYSIDYDSWTRLKFKKEEFLTVSIMTGHNDNAIMQEMILELKNVLKLDNIIRFGYSFSGESPSDIYPDFINPDYSNVADAIEKTLMKNYGKIVTTMELHVTFKL